MTAARKAPDGASWPLPFVAIDTSEQRPWAFGFVPAPWREGAPVHVGELADPGHSLVTQLLDGPWPSARANLETGDYQLLDGHGRPLPAALAPCVERKAPGDLVSSLTAGHDRFIDGEIPRLAAFRTPVVIAEAPLEWLLGGRSPALVALWALRERAEGMLDDFSRELGDGDESVVDYIAGEREGLQLLDDMLSGLRYEREAHRSGAKVRAMLGSLLSIFTDHRVLPVPVPDRRWAEYAAAWILRRGWRRWLTEEWAAGRRESLEAVRAQRAGWASPVAPGEAKGAA
jgi:hypothetical protein